MNTLSSLILTTMVAGEVATPMSLELWFPIPGSISMSQIMSKSNIKMYKASGATFNHLKHGFQAYTIRHSNIRVQEPSECPTILQSRLLQLGRQILQYRNVQFINVRYSDIRISDSLFCDIMVSVLIYQL